MLRNSLIFSFLLLLLPVKAQQLPNAVRAIADDFFSNSGSDRMYAPAVKSSLELIELIYSSPDNLKSRVFALHQKGSGILVVQSTPQGTRIVGYSNNTTPASDELPSNFMGMMKTYEAVADKSMEKQTYQLTGLQGDTESSQAEIDYSKYEAEKNISLSMQSDFRAFTPEEVLKAKAVVAPMLDAAGIHLNQFGHQEVGDCPSGCVATALVQIMAFHKYPDKGKSSHCYTSRYGQQCADFENTVYNWSQPDDEFFKMVSKQVGVATEMEYCRDYNGSAPGALNYLTQFSEYFRYYMKIISNPYTDYVIMELDQKRPVYLETYGDPGHALVMDGYDSNGFLHLNFGWGGAFDGYYLMNTNTLIEGTSFGSNMYRIAMLSPTPFRVNEADSTVLKSLNTKLNNRWDEQTPMINWKGLSFVGGKVVEIDMTGTSYLNGTVPEEFGQLDQLFSFRIGGKLTGQLPSSIFNLKKLRILSIDSYEEQLNTTIPSTIGGLSNLKELVLSRCLSGSLPEEIGNLQALIKLKLWKNRLSGPIPESVSRLSKLFILELPENCLSGEVPASFSKLEQLAFLNLAKNEFSGAIPDCFTNLSKLNELNLSENKFEGTLPPSVSQLKALTKLVVAGNRLSGLVPEVFDSLVSLTTLELNDNQFTGLPVGIGNLKSLTRLDLTRNNISVLPTELGNCTELRVLNMYGNKLSDLPSSLGRLGNLREINLGANGLKQIPMSLINYTSLRVLNLSFNELSSVPEVLTIITPEELYLNDNHMRGAIPVELLSRTYNMFDLKNNHFIYRDIPKSDSIVNPVNQQRVVPLVADSFGLIPGDTLRLNARKIISEISPNDVFNWYSFDPADPASKPRLEMTDSVLVLPGSEQLFNKRYYCVIKNSDEPKYKYMGSLKLSSLPQLMTDTFQLYPWTEQDYLNDVYQTKVLASENVGNNSVSDRYVTLISPRKLRGQQVWQGSTDRQTWYDMKPEMAEQTLRKNLISVQEKELVLYPKTTAWYRNALLESRCVPRYSDTIQVAPLGEFICDTIVQVTNETKIISLDSLEITLPKGLIAGNFQLSVIQSDQIPTLPSGVLSHGKMYEVHLDKASQFDIPLTIKFKNLHKESFDARKIENYRAAYFDEHIQEWVFFDQSVVDLNDTTIVFYTNHLTKLAWFEIAHSGYTHIYTIPRVNVIYNNDAFYMNEVAAYDRMAAGSLNSWNTADTDPDSKSGAPYMIQDIANYARQVIEAFEGVGFPVPSLRFNVYLKALGSAAGQVDIGTYLAGRGYIYIDPIMSTTMKDDLKGKREYLKSVIAHEYMHFTQDYYMTVAVGNSFWMEATAPLAGKIAWPLTKDLEVPEPELLLEEALNTSPNESSIFDVLAKPWYNSYNIPIVSKVASSGSTAEMNLASLFLHYMATYRTSNKLNAVDLLKNTPYLSSWVSYLSEFVGQNLTDDMGASDLGKEYDNFVRFLYEGKMVHFSVFNKDKDKDEDPLKYLKANYKSFVNKYVRFVWNKPEQKDKLSLSLGSLSSKMVQIYNLNNHQLMLIKYYRKSKPENLAVYTGKYNGTTKLMEWTDVSDKDTISVLAGAYDPTEPANNDYMTYLLFVNKSTGDVLNTSINDDLEFFLLPDLKFFDGPVFVRPYSTTPLAIQTIEEEEGLKVLFGGTEGESFGPGVYRVFATTFGTPVSFHQEVTDSTMRVTATSSVIDQYMEYNFLRDKLIINHKMHLEQRQYKVTYEDEFNGVFENVIIRFTGSNRWSANRYNFHTMNSAETRASMKSLHYMRKRIQDGVDDKGMPIQTVTTKTYTSTTYPYDDIQLHLLFY